MKTIVAALIVSIALQWQPPAAEAGPIRNIVRKIIDRFKERREARMERRSERMDNRQQRLDARMGVAMESEQRFMPLPGTVGVGGECHGGGASGQFKWDI